MDQLILNELKRLRRLYPEINHSFKVCFDLKELNIYGAYQSKTKILYFDLVIANKIGFDIFREVVVHEFVHYINDIKYNNVKHNKLWKKEMNFCGVSNPRSTIYFKDIILSNNLFSVRCNCDTYHITRNRLTRLNNGRKYRCPSCKGLLKIV